MGNRKISSRRRGRMGEGVRHNNARVTVSCDPVTHVSCVLAHGSTHMRSKELQDKDKILAMFFLTISLVCVCDRLTSLRTAHHFLGPPPSHFGPLTSNNKIKDKIRRVFSLSYVCVIVMILKGELYLSFLIEMALTENGIYPCYSTFLRKKAFTW